MPNHHRIKAYWRKDNKLHLALYEGTLPVSRFSPVNDWVGSWVSHTVGLDTVTAKRKNSCKFLLFKKKQSVSSKSVDMYAKFIITHTANII